MVRGPGGSIPRQGSLSRCARRNAKEGMGEHWGMWPPFREKVFRFGRENAGDFYRGKILKTVQKGKEGSGCVCGHR